MFLNDRERWNEIRNSAEYKPLRDKIENEYKRRCENKDIPRLTFKLETELLRTGNRNKFESVYKEKRVQMTLYALMLLLYPDNNCYKEGLEEVVCDICNEYSWALPAHRAPIYFNERDGIDLYAAETGLYLAEIKAMFSDKLHPYVIERITNELKWRIIENFKNNTFWFETLKSNWASVCGGSVGAVFLYENPEEHNKVFKRIEKCMQNYIDGFSDDGATSEGGVYWRYGFSFYVLYADLLRRYTCGRVNYFDMDKVKKIAGFFNSICLDNKNLVCFSDSSIQLVYQPFITCFLNREYGIELPPLEGEEMEYTEFSCSVRSCIYYNPRQKSDKLLPMKKHYDKVQWYIERKDKYSFAAKAGHNAEEHNHNDIGSFIITHNENVIFTDLGRPEYTLTSSNLDSYEKILNKSSLGHSVPIVNGIAQKYGKEYRGDLTVNGDEINIDFSEAYPIDINKLTRSFKLFDDSIIMIDSFDSNLDVTERFVTEIEPQINAGSIIIGGVKMIFSEKYKVSCKYEDVSSRFGETMRRVYLIDFENFDSEFEIKIEF